MIYGDNISDNRQKVRYIQLLHSTAKIRLVQHCAAISAVAELLFNIPLARAQFSAHLSIYAAKLYPRNHLSFIGILL